MNKKEKARPIVAATGQAAGTAAYDRAAISYPDFTTAAAGRQPNISDLLSKGQENASPLRHLETITGRNGRTIRLEIERARRSGIPILSDGGGYYLPGNHSELERFVQSMLRRAREIEITARAVRRCRFD